MRNLTANSLFSLESLFIKPALGNSDNLQTFWGLMCFRLIKKSLESKKHLLFSQQIFRDLKRFFDACKKTLLLFS